MLLLEEILERIRSAIPDARVELMRNPSLASQHSLRVDRGHAMEVAQFLRDDPEVKLDYCSCVTGVDWLDQVHQERVKVMRVVDGVEREFEDVIEIKRSGYLEAVYHLYSMSLRHGPVVLRMRTEDRAERTRMPSLTPVWRGCELQEREVYDLYGIVFEGHPDLRRLLMWEGFEDFPMRKDYVEPEDYEYEPTAHGKVQEKAARHSRPEAR
jgi:NADH-quinone oxidoreductase subunit C